MCVCVCVCDSLEPLAAGHVLFSVQCDISVARVWNLDVGWAQRV